MALRAVQNEKNSGKTSYLKSAAIGAITGYSLKYILPVTKTEKDENYQAALNQVNVRAKEAKIAEIENIRNSKNRSVTADVFLHKYSSKKTSFFVFRKNKKMLTQDLKEFVKKINDIARTQRIKGRNDVNLITKSIRPTGVFVGVGIATGLIIAALKNIFNGIAEDQSEGCDC